ncbi:hypothetical protein JCM11251_001183 [Rhodosporidiobolus azoricus]
MSGDSSDGYDFPSDDDGYLDDDWLALDEGSDDPAAEETRTAASDTPLPLDLAAFRRNWLEEVDLTASHRHTASARSRKPLPDSPFTRLFSHPDLIDHILSSPVLLPADLSSLALAHTIFRLPSQSLLFRDVATPTLLRASALSALFDSNPSLAQVVQTATLSLGNALEMASEAVAVQEKMWDKKRKEESQAIDYYWTTEGKSVARRQWEVDLRKSIRSRVDQSDTSILARARRNSHITWALSKLGKKDREVLVAQLRAEVLQWPLGPVPSTPIRHLFEYLAPSLVELTLIPPLSHHFFALFTILPTFSSVRGLTVQGDPSCVLRFDDKFSTLDWCKAMQQVVRLPAPILALKDKSVGLLGAPPGVAKLKLESVILYWEGGVKKMLADDEEEGPSWQLDELELRNVVVKRSPAGWRLRFDAGEPLDDFIKSKKHETPLPDFVKARFAPDPLLYLHLANFVGPSASLASLVLVDVDGVVPSTIYLAIHEAGPSLRHLTLHNINLSLSPSSSSSTGSRAPTESLVVDFPLTPFPLTSQTYAYQKSRRTQLVQLVERAEHWYRFDTSSLPSSSLILAHAHKAFWPLTTLPSALKRCTTLRILRLGASAQRASNSPYTPAILDALLETRPPLEALSVRLSVEGPTRAEGFLEVEGWEEVGKKVEEMGKWETIKTEDSTVVVALRTSRRQIGSSSIE